MNKNLTGLQIKFYIKIIYKILIIWRQAIRHHYTSQLTPPRLLINSSILHIQFSTASGLDTEVFIGKTLGHIHCHNSLFYSFNLSSLLSINPRFAQERSCYFCTKLLFIWTHLWLFSSFFLVPPLAVTALSHPVQSGCFSLRMTLTFGMEDKDMHHKRLGLEEEASISWHLIWLGASGRVGNAGGRDHGAWEKDWGLEGVKQATKLRNRREALKQTTTCALMP